MSDQVMGPASEAEAELARTATACLVAALDHSRAEKIKVTIDTEVEGDMPVLMLPPRALRMLAHILRQMAKREPMLLLPQKLEVTTQEAASFLNVSRPFVIKEIQAGHLACRMVNSHRRISFEELQRYQREQKQRSEDALRQLRKVSDEMGEEL